MLLGVILEGHRWHLPKLQTKQPSNPAAARTRPDSQDLKNVQDLVRNGAFAGKADRAEFSRRASSFACGGSVTRLSSREDCVRMRGAASAFKKDWRFAEDYSAHLLALAPRGMVSMTVIRG
jgi:hypothetical protein